ncbi:hypothetical protein L207DRAFT_581390 [Hyaloscypha variabilis F]|uniref:EF-hand domain-containing protein n=1 Tax=Hyaloscypha variabilis (strain UAMH 11265 / GT02V1 / F) TaxID=1149755 RepID=A0A2J6RW45_HYAVF|nr:hypothetical protein L207DRAFT_581390 [Hyaloscypha variabilis F]
MSFGFGVYDGCKTSVDEYRDIGRDVGNAHLVLSAIQRYWKAEESRGRELIVLQQEDLKQLAGNSREILGKIQEVLDKHRSLGDRGRVRDQLKWSLTSFTRDIGPHRQSLQNNTHALAIFNATLTAENASGTADQQMKILEEHSQLLKFLVTRYWEFQNGVGDRRAPAFSSVTVKDIEEEEDDSWRNIDTELEEAGFEAKTVRGNRGFIREWITTVVPPEGEKETAFNASSTIAEEDDDTVVETEGDKAASGAQNDGVAKRTEGGPTKAVQTNIHSGSPPPPPPPPISISPPRPTSANTHRSQSSAWRESDSDNATYVSQMLAKVLKSKYGENCDHLYRVPIKRAFYHLDWTDRGWISIGEVQKYCHQAAALAGFTLNEWALGWLAKKMDVDDDNQVSLDELIEMVLALRQIILDAIIIANANSAGRIEAGTQLKAFFDTSNDKSMLPFGWVNNYWHPTLLPLREYRHDLVHSNLGTYQCIAPLQINFTNAAFIATGHCASQVADALNYWRNALKSMPKEHAVEYTEALDNVLKATAKFHILDSRQFPEKLHPFDYCSERIKILPPGQIEGLADCPGAELAELSDKCWKILDPILGFVYDLKPDWLKQVFLQSSSKVLFVLSTTPPTLSEWRRLRMLERSRRIKQDLSHWDEMKKSIQKYQEWCNANSAHLEVKTTSAIETAKDLYQLQQDVARDASLNRLEIREVSLDKLKRDRFGRSPNTLFTITIDGLRKGISDSQKSIAPLWYHGIDYEVSRKSVIRVEFHDGKSYDDSSTVTDSRRLIGSLEFKMADVTNFEGLSTVTYKRPLILPTSSILKSSPPEVQVKASTDWRRWEPVGSEEYNLATNIAKNSTPPGWEARRTKANDVYFINSQEGKSTACLWREIVPIESDDAPNKVMPLPPGWTITAVNGKVVYTSPTREVSESAPDADEKTTFAKVVKSKDYSQPPEFFPQYLIDQYEKEAFGLNTR